jgi:hypothetical protein
VPEHLDPAVPSIASSSLYGSIYPSVQNLLLAARAAGLGAALITLPLWSRMLARWALGLPWNVTPCAVVPMGWPIGRYGPTTRKPVEEIVSLDRHGNRALPPPMSTRFGAIRQIAFVVRDLEPALDYWTQTLGVGPFFVFRRIAVWRTSVIAASRRRRPA